MYFGGGVSKLLRKFAGPLKEQHLLGLRSRIASACESENLEARIMDLIVCTYWSNRNQQSALGIVIFVRLGHAQRRGCTHTISRGLAIVRLRKLTASLPTVYLLLA